MVKILFENNSNFLNLFRKVLIKRDTIDNKVDKKVQDIIEKVIRFSFVKTYKKIR